MAEIIQHIYQFKRGTAKRWNQLNPILKQGEPGFEYDTGKLKIGDGFTPWKALKYINSSNNGDIVYEASVYNAPTKNDFPTIGNPAIIYKAEDEAKLYQWNEISEEYEALTGSDIVEINNTISEIVIKKGADHLEAINNELDGKTPIKNDIFIIKEPIAEDNYTFTAYVYSGENWKAFNGNYNADNVYFDSDFIFTKPIGTVTIPSSGSVTIARDETGVQVSGTVSAPAITVTPNTASVQHIDSLGKLPEYTAAQYVAPKVAEAKAQFAAEGLVAAIDGEDAEMLVFTAANKADALTSTGFDAGSYTPAEFTNGELPTLGEAINVVTGIKEAKAEAPVFTGDKFGATFTGSETEITAGFEGTEATVNVAGNYDKATAAAGTFTGTDATIAPTLVKGTKTITVQ